MKMETSDIITVSVIGVYTLVYLIIFFIQKAQIDRHKSVIEAMERFMNIFKLEEVERFVNMRHEGTLDQVKKHIRDNVDRWKEEIIDPEITKGIEQLDETRIERFQEMSDLVYGVILSVPIDEQKQFIENHLPLNKEMFLDALLEDGETISSQKDSPDD